MRKTKGKIRARLYSGIMLERGICTLCGNECLICRDKTSSCCYGPAIIYQHGRISKETASTVRKQRKQPSYNAKIKILNEQDNCCYWCGREFGNYVISPKLNLVMLRPIWDHYIPYSFCGSSSNENFVASCQRCNSHKGAKLVAVVKDEESLRQYLKRRWYHGGWMDIPNSSSESQDA
jgi:5-methylcytosine-specific restriction endonuclease McrA